MTASVLNNKQFFFLAAVAAVGAGYLYMKRKDIGEAVNPVSRNNLAYKATNEVGQALSGDEHFSLGVLIWEMANPQAVQREKELFM